MKVKILFMATGNIEEIKISSGLWGGLHNHRVEHFYNKEYDKFFKKYNLKPTIFNLNCLDVLRGVILTDAQILKLKEMKGGLE
jgi:hypothetical protein